MSSIRPVTTGGQDVWQIGGRTASKAVRFEDDSIATRFVGLMSVSFTTVLPGSRPVRSKVKLER